MAGAWDAGAREVMSLPSGRLIRGRGLRHPGPAGPGPEFALYLLPGAPADVPGEFRWVPWPDFRLPVSPAAARAAFTEAWERSAAERVEVACLGGVGRTGTALACIAVLDGVAPGEAVGYVRRHYHPRAVETFRQRRFVRRFTARLSTDLVDKRGRHAGQDYGRTGANSGLPLSIRIRRCPLTCAAGCA